MLFKKIQNTCSASSKIFIRSAATAQSLRVMRLILSPVRPALPVLPTRCTYSSMSFGKS